jgi:hypothetical protein
MLQSARDAVTLGPAVFREHLIAYLEESEFTRKVRGHEDGRTRPVAVGARRGRRPRRRDWAAGACRRDLEEDPGTRPADARRHAAWPISAAASGQDISGAFAASAAAAFDAAARVALAGRLLACIERPGALEPR